MPARGYAFYLRVFKLTSEWEINLNTTRLKLYVCTSRHVIFSLSYIHWWNNRTTISWTNLLFIEIYVSQYLSLCVGIFFHLDQIINVAKCYRNKPSTSPFVLLIVENIYVKIWYLIWKFHLFFKTTDLWMKTVNGCDAAMVIYYWLHWSTTTNVISSHCERWKWYLHWIPIKYLSVEKSWYFMGVYIIIIIIFI